LSESQAIYSLICYLAYFVTYTASSCPVQPVPSPADLTHTMAPQSLCYSL